MQVNYFLYFLILLLWLDLLLLPRNSIELLLLLCMLLIHCLFIWLFVVVVKVSRLRWWYGFFVFCLRGMVILFLMMLSIRRLNFRIIGNLLCWVMCCMGYGSTSGYIQLYSCQSSYCIRRSSVKKLKQVSYQNS